MTALMWLAAIVAGLVHVLIFCMESLLWTTPAVQIRFRQSPEQAQATKQFAFNQGFYNLFLALGTFAGLAAVVTGHPRVGWTLVYWNCAFMVGAALVLAGSAPQLRRGAVIQGAAPFLFFALAAIRWAGAM
jgi:putative membrane protein